MSARPRVRGSALARITAPSLASALATVALLACSASAGPPPSELNPPMDQPSEIDTGPATTPAAPGGPRDPSGDAEAPTRASPEPGHGRCCDTAGRCGDWRVYASAADLAKTCANQGAPNEVWCPERCEFDAAERPACSCD